MSKPTQTDRVLALLRTRGTAGISPLDFDPSPGSTVADGGSRITRVAARVRDLRDQGHTIVKVGDTREGFARYVLTGTASSWDRIPDVPGWTREWQCYAPVGTAGYCLAHLHGEISETCPRGHASVLAHVLDTRRLATGEMEQAA